VIVAPVLFLVGLLPASRLKNALLTLWGRDWSVARSARIHPTVLWRVGRLVVGEGAQVGPGNVVRDMVRLELGPDTSVGQFNWITGEARYAEQDDPARAGTLVLREGAALVSRHYVDCAGGLEIGRMAILAGVRSTVLTHWADHQNWRLRAAPVVMGPCCIVSSTVTLTAGAVVPQGSIVAAGAVVAKALGDPDTLYGGVPAKHIAALSGSAHARRTAARFTRGPVDATDVDTTAGTARPHARSASH
jgi:hypothetical protein